MSTLAQIADRIGPLIGRLGSPHDGEVVSAARALARQLDKAGLNFNDMAVALKAEPSEKRAAWLNSILDRIRKEMAA